MCKVLRATPGTLLGVAGTMLLHLACLGLLVNPATPGWRLRESGQSGQMTFYVGMLQAEAAPATLVQDGATQQSPPGNLSNKRGAGELGAPSPMRFGKHPKGDTRDEFLSTFLSARVLDVAATPTSEPEYSLLLGLPNSHMPMRLRLFIDENGKLADIRVLQADERDDATVTKVRAMFFIAHYLPGRLNRVERRSYIDIEFNIDDRIPPPATFDEPNSSVK